MSNFRARNLSKLTIKSLSKLTARRAFLLGGLSTIITTPAVSKGKKKAPPPVRIVDHKTVTTTKGKYHRYISYLQKDLIKQDIVPPSVVKEAMKLAYTPNATSQSILRQANNQPEFKWSWSKYSSKILTSKRKDLGRSMFEANEDVLYLVKRRYAVDLQPILGIWGLETKFGEIKGTYNVFESLVTLAFEGRREHFFRLQIIAALKILKETGKKPEDLMGSYAGAMGNPQFMPEAYLRYAVSMTGGVPDIWNSVPDSLASIGNYLKGSGWILGQTWGQKVELNQRKYDQISDHAIDHYDMTHALTVKEWAKMGVNPLAGHSFPKPDQKAVLVQPDGIQGDSYLLYPNFKALMRYNSSLYYGIAVGLLGDASIPEI